MANGFALVKRVGPADAGADTRLQPSTATHRTTEPWRLRRGIGMTPNLQRAEQHPTRGGYIPDRGVEHVLVGLRGSVEAADLAHELQRRVMQLRVRRWVIRVTQTLDVSAHRDQTFRKAVSRRTRLTCVPARAGATASRPAALTLTRLATSPPGDHVYHARHPRHPKHPERRVWTVGQGPRRVLGRRRGSHPLVQAMGAGAR